MHEGFNRRNRAKEIIKDEDHEEAVDEEVDHIYEENKNSQK